jgi:hypothetical protein
VVGPGDSLLITVTFTPADDSVVNDTLHLDNSDRNVVVVLSGTGQYPVGVVKGREPGIRRFGLRQAGANPVGSGATFVFDLPRRTWVSLKVCNNLGREVATVVLQEMDAGSHRCAWTRKGLPAGSYFFLLDAGDNRASGNFVLLR